MSGGFPKLSSKGYIEPPLQKRPELQKPNPDIVVKLPQRSEIRVIASVNNDLEPLARVFKRFQVAGQPTLTFEVDDYTADAPIEELYYDKMSDYAKEILQACLHEMMHMALWDDSTISHSPDKTSILYYYVDGSTLRPNSWDLSVMKEAAQRIGRISIEMRDLRSHNIDYYMRAAAQNWNMDIGRPFFELI